MNHPRTNILNPGENDILCGRGGGTNAHKGNIKFRKLVAAHKLRYLAASKSDKPNVARDVVKEWRAMDPPGRFLAKMDMKQMILENLITLEDVKELQAEEKQRQLLQAQAAASSEDSSGGESDGGGGGGGTSKSSKTEVVYWYDVGDKKAREKASQCLRERNGAANEAVAALVKTVTATGEACPEDYTTLMSKAARVKEQQQQHMMQQQHFQEQQQTMMMQQMGGGGGGMGMGANQSNIITSMGGYGDYRCEPVMSNNSNEDDVIEAEIQRLLREKQEQMVNNMGRKNNNQGRGGGAGGNKYGFGGNNGFGGDIQPYMGEESMMREYQELLKRQQELDERLARANFMISQQQQQQQLGAMTSSHYNTNSMGGMMEGVGGGYGSQQQQQLLHQQQQQYMDSPQSMMSPSNPNPNAARDYLNRLHMLKQGNHGIELPHNQYGGGGGMPENISSSSMGMNNMGNNNMNLNNMVLGGGGGGGNMSDMGGGGVKSQNDFRIEEYQASLQEFLYHDDDGNVGGGGLGISNQHSMTSQATKSYSNVGKSIQVPTNFNDGSRRSNAQRRGSDRSVDDIDLPIGRHTFKSVDSAERPSFQSMDDVGIRDTFRSVDTMDLMSLGASLNEIVDEEIMKNPEVREKFSRRLSASSRHSRYASANNKVGAMTLNDFAHLPGATVEVKTMNHGQGGGAGPKKIRKAIDPRLIAMAGTSGGVATKTDNVRGSNLSTDLDLDGLEDGRMSFGNMSLMSELTDFGDVIAKSMGDGDL